MILLVNLLIPCYVSLCFSVNTAIKSIDQKLKVEANQRLKLPKESQCELLVQIMLSGLGDRVARKLPSDIIGKDGKKLKNAYQVIFFFCV